MEKGKHLSTSFFGCYWVNVLGNSKSGVGRGETILRYYSIHLNQHPCIDIAILSHASQSAPIFSLLMFFIGSKKSPDSNRFQPMCI